MTRRILITGATGFVGRQVLKALLEGDTRLICVMRNESSKEIPHSPQIEKKVLTKNLFSEEEVWWREILQGVDTIVHLAWYVEPATYQTSKKNLDCLIGTLQIAKAALRAGVRRFVGVGTCLEYKSSTASFHDGSAFAIITLCSLQSSDLSRFARIASPGRHRIRLVSFVLSAWGRRGSTTSGANSSEQVEQRAKSRTHRGVAGTGLYGCPPSGSPDC